MFGVGATCLRGRALQHFVDVKTTLGGNAPARFAATLDLVKRNYFLTDTPRHDQIEYMKTLKKPISIFWKEYASFIDYIQATLQYPPVIWTRMVLLKVRSLPSPKTYAAKYILLADHRIGSRKSPMTERILLE